VIDERAEIGERATSRGASRIGRNVSKEMSEPTYQSEPEAMSETSRTSAPYMTIEPVIGERTVVDERAASMSAPRSTSVSR
jgi:hypothetical protein